MRLLGSTKRRITKDICGENVLQLKITEIALVQCNIVQNNNSRVLCTFVPEKSFNRLLNISPTNHTSFDIFHSEFSSSEI